MSALRSLLVAAGLSCVLAISFPAHAQTAADKLTARQLATEGIEFHEAGRHAEALDRLERAQELFDAPPHLLYIARAQAALGQVVEAAETYRTLARTELAPDAPRPFRDAVAEGGKELGALEPKIPALRIELVPAGAIGVELRIDDQRVAAAVVGVDRPINPGRHRVEVTASGFAPAERSIEVELGQKQTLAIELVPLPADSGQPAAVPAPGAALADPAPSAPEESGGVGFMLGLRLGGAYPAGKLREQEPGGTSTDIGDWFGPGGGLELHAGLRFARLFTVKLMAGGYVFDAGTQAKAASAGAQPDATTSGSAAGIGLEVGSPRGSTGAFGEILLLPHHQMLVERKYHDDNCMETLKFSGGALGLGGGARIALGSSWRLAPFANLQLARFDRAKVETNCSAIDAQADDVPQSEQAGHSLFVIGLGGEYLLGADKPSK
jgi:hypothetical protein